MHLHFGTKQQDETDVEASKADALAIVFAVYQTEQARINGVLQGQVTNLQTQVTNLQTMNAHLAHGDYQTLAVIILDRIRDTHTPSLPPNQRKTYYLDMVGAGYQVVMQGMKLIDAALPEAQTAAEIDTLKEDRNNNTHPKSITDIDQRVSEALLDLKNNPSTNAAFAVSHARLHSILQKYVDLKNHFNLK